MERKNELEELNVLINAFKNVSWLLSKSYEMQTEEENMENSKLQEEFEADQETIQELKNELYHKAILYIEKLNKN